jgi:DNA repair protein SbcD/Mre11
MQARFIHFADCHLGYRQYNHKERFNDFARAFVDVIDKAIAQRVDFVLLAGDLFQKRAIDALTLNQAMNGLERLKRANIPCIAIEGNHEHAYYQDHIGWLQFLNLRQLLILLDADFEGGKPQLMRYGNRKGSFVDPVPGLRVHGLRYYGASTAKALEGYAAALEEVPKDGIEYTIFLTHAGMEGVVAEQSGGLTYRQWSPMRPHVDYVALGHVHKPFEMEGWIHNPGSLETCSMMECSWEERGYYLVTVDTARARETGEAKHTAQLCANSRRTFHRLSLKTDLYTTPDALYSHCREFLQRRARDLGVRRRDGSDDSSVRPVVELQLTGVLPFDRSVLEIARYEEMVMEIFDPLLVLVKNATGATAFEIEAGDGMSRLQLERQVMANLFNNDGRYSARSGEWARAALALKRLVLEGADPDAILEELETQIEAVEGKDSSAGEAASL